MLPVEIWTLVVERLDILSLQSFSLVAKSYFTIGRGELMKRIKRWYGHEITWGRWLQLAAQHKNQWLKDLSKATFKDIRLLDAVTCSNKYPRFRLKPVEYMWFPEKTSWIPQGILQRILPACPHRSWKNTKAHWARQQKYGGHECDQDCIVREICLCSDKGTLQPEEILFYVKEAFKKYLQTQ
jgi:hypothetical protein